MKYEKYGWIILFICTIALASSWQVITDSTTAFQWLKSDGTVILNIDTTNERVGIGTLDPNEALDVEGNILVDEYIEIEDNGPPGTTTNRLYSNSGVLYYDGVNLEAGGGGSGSVTTVKRGGTQLGDADIVTLDFNSVFLNTTEDPDTEINIDFYDTNITRVGTIATGTWEATDIGVQHGGTGASSLNDLITLTTHTAGDYVASITNGSGISGGDGGSEGAVLTLAATLGTAIDSTEITDNEVNEPDLKVTNSPTDNYVLTYDAATKSFTWAEDATGGNTAWDDIGDPDGNGVVDFGAHVQELDVNDFRIGATDAGNYMKIAGNAVTFVGTGDIDLPDDSVDTADIGTDQVGLDALNVSDVSDDIAGDIAEGELANDIIVEADLKAVDAAVDEDILTYESTTGDFEWHTGAELGIGTATAITDGLIVEADLDEDSGTPTDEDLLEYDSTGANFNWVTKASVVSAARVGAASANLDDTDASIEWEDATDLESDGSLSIDVVAAAEMADADHGDVAWSSGVATVEEVTISDDESTADNHEVVFTTDNANLESDGDFHYNPSTGTVTATEFSGGGSGLTSVDAATGDSATGFFDAGTIEHERGGLEADVSAYTGLLGITGGTTAEVNTAAELETYAGLGAFANEYLDDADASTMRTTLGLAIGTDVLAQQTIGIANDNLVEMDDADAADNDYAKITANGLEGRSYSEVADDLDIPGMTSGTPKIIFAFCIHDIDDGMDDIAIQFPRAMTITKVTAMCIGGTNVVGRLYEVDGDGVDSDAVGVEASDWTFTTTETEDSSFNNASLDAGDYLQWDTTSVSGSVTCFRLTVEGYET